MKNFNYKEEIDNIHADEKWKHDLKQSLYKKEERKTTYIMKYAMVGIACMLLVGIGVFSLYPKQPPTSEIPNPGSNKNPITDITPNKLAVLDIESFQSGSMGYEAMMQQSAEEMQWDSPWNFDNGVQTLPVIKNVNRSDGGGVTLATISEEELYTIGKSYVDRFGFTILSHEGDNVTSYKEGVTGYKFQCEEAEIYVEEKGSVAIWFHQAYISEHFIPLNYEATSKEEAQKSLQDAYAPFADIIGFKKPIFQANLDYLVMEDGAKKHWSYYVYDGSGSEAEQLLSKEFHKVYFYGDENNQLYGLRFSIEDIQTIVDDYPIITLAEAKQRLLDGIFFASAPMGDFHHIVHVEMTYNANKANENFMPYYRFYAPLKDTLLENIGSLTTYGAYYVPAIQSEYIKELPTNDRFYN